MIDGWKHYDLAIDTRKLQITPVEELLEPSMISPNALWSMNSLDRPAAAFIYRFNRPPTELKRRAEASDAVLRTGTIQGGDDCFDLFVHAKMEEGHLLYDIKYGNPVIVETPIEFTDDLIASARIIAPEKILENTYRNIGERPGVCIEGVGYCRPMENDPLEMLTDRQEEILRAAIEKGYYAIPRRTSQEALGEHFGIEPQTIGEHLRKIESKIIKQVPVGGETAVASRASGAPRNVRG